MFKKYIHIFLIASLSMLVAFQAANAKLCINRCHEKRSDCLYDAKKDKTKIKQCRITESSCIDWCSKCIKDSMSTLKACIEKADSENATDDACYSDYDTSLILCDKGSN